MPALDQCHPQVVRVLKKEAIIQCNGCTDKPLVDALMINGGVPREKIILAYKGEKLTEGA